MDQAFFVICCLCHYFWFLVLRAFYWRLHLGDVVLLICDIQRNSQATFVLAVSWFGVRLPEDNRVGWHGVRLADIYFLVERNVESLGSADVVYVESPLTHRTLVEIITLVHNIILPYLFFI